MKRWTNRRPHMSGSRLIRKPWKFPLNPIYETCQSTNSETLLEPACETELVPGKRGCSSWSRSADHIVPMYCDCLLLGSLTALQLGRWSNLQVIAVVHYYGRRRSGISVNWVKPLIAAIRLGHLHRLKQLQLSSIRFQDSEMIELSMAMNTGNLSVLEKLDLHSNVIGVDGTIALAQVIKNGHLRCLISLRLGSKHKGERDEGLIMLASRLESGQLNNLKRFCVSAGTHHSYRCGYYYVMSPASSKAFVQAYRKNPLLIVSVEDQMWSTESLKWSAKEFLERNMESRTKIFSELHIQK